MTDLFDLPFEEEPEPEPEPAPPSGEPTPATAADGLQAVPQRLSRRLKRPPVVSSPSPS